MAFDVARSIPCILSAVRPSAVNRIVKRALGDG